MNIREPTRRKQGKPLTVEEKDAISRIYDTTRQDLKDLKNPESEVSMCSVTKLYISRTIKTQMNLVPFCFSADWAIRAILKKENFSFNMYFFGLKSRSGKKSMFIVFGIYRFGVHLSGTGVT